MKEKLKQTHCQKIWLFLEVLKLPATRVFSFYNLAEMYISGIVKGALSHEREVFLLVFIAFSFFTFYTEPDCFYPH